MTCNASLEPNSAQTNFDLLGELIKCNPEVFAMLNDILDETKYTAFMQALSPACPPFTVWPFGLSASARSHVSLLFRVALACLPPLPPSQMSPSLRFFSLLSLLPPLLPRLFSPPPPPPLSVRQRLGDSKCRRLFEESKWIRLLREEDKLVS
jgi:hypothetical protein